jgi:hypothetical protein
LLKNCLNSWNPLTESLQMTIDSSGV